MSKELIAIRLQQSQNDTNSKWMLATAPTICLCWFFFFSLTDIIIWFPAVIQCLISMLKLSIVLDWICVHFTQQAWQYEESKHWGSAILQRERERQRAVWYYFSLSLPLSPSSLIKEINLYSDSFRLCSALQKGAISNLIKEDGIHVWNRLRVITCSYFIMKIRRWKILWSILTQLKCNRYCAIKKKYSYYDVH